MKRSINPTDLLIGLMGACFALIALFVWFPSDIDTGVVDVWRRNVRIGDAMLPTFAGIGILITSLVIGVRSVLTGPTVELREMSFKFIILAFLFMTVSITVMWLTGPLLVSLTQDPETSYRLLLNTAPWKYLGFVAGGAIMCFSFTALTSHKVRRRHAVIAIVATLAIAMIYDLPFDNLLLPPNGDF